MADNLTAPASGSVLATDEIAGVHYPRTKLSIGADGVAVDVSAAAPLPVGVVGTVPVSGTFYQATQPVSAASLPLPAGAATSAKQDAIVAAISGATYYPGTQPVSGTVGVSGSVAVTGTFWQATQPISAAALPLPTGAATETTLAALNTKTPALGQAVAASSQPVVIASDQTPLTAGGLTAVVTATFNRPANTTAYASGQLVANSTTAGSVVPLSLAAARINAGTGAIRRVRLSTNKTGLAGNEVFRVHLFKTSPTVANGDNGAFSVNGVAAVHLGIFDITLDRVFNDGAKGVAAPIVGSEILFDAGTGTQNIFALIEARGAYTPASGETFVLALEVMRD